MLAGKAGNKAKCRIIYAQAIQHNGDIDALAAEKDLLPGAAQNLPLGQRRLSPPNAKSLMRIE